MDEPDLTFWVHWWTWLSSLNSDIRFIFIVHLIFPEMKLIRILVFPRLETVDFSYYLNHIFKSWTEFGVLFTSTGTLNVRCHDYNICKSLLWLRMLTAGFYVCEHLFRGMSLVFSHASNPGNHLKQWKMGLAGRIP
jgi:hypothetical protein